MTKPLTTFITGFLLIGVLLFSACNARARSAGNNSADIPAIDTRFPNADPNFHIYIAFGQSNMQGPGGIEAQDTEHVTDRFQILNVIPGVYAGEDRQKSEWYKAAPPLILPDSGLINWQGIPIGLSPAGNFGWTLTQSPKVPANVTIGVVAVAHGDLGLAAFSKDNAIVQGYYQDSASDTVKQGITRYSNVYSPGQYDGLYQALVQNVRLAQEAGVIKGIIVHQGESGIANSGTISGFTWASMFTSIYNELLADLGLPANSLPVIAGQPYGGQGETSAGGTGNTDGALSDDDALRTATGIPNAYVISSTGLPGRANLQGQLDHIHFSSAGLRTLGERYAEKMIELVY